MTVWWTVVATTLWGIVIYFAYFWKMNWVKDLRERGGGNGRARVMGNRTRKIGDLPPVYPNGWFSLLESSQLKRGQVKHIAALGQNFAVFRTNKGVVSVLDAYCPHLGANMGEGGHVRGECLECPFHGWLFRGEDGRCQKIPYSDKVPEKARTRTWQCCEVNGFIFVWHHAESAEPEWRPQPLEQISNGNWRYRGRNEYLVNSHIQEIPENGADWAHLSAVHGPSMVLSEQIPWLARHSWSQAVWAPRSSQPHHQAENSEPKPEKNDELQDEDDVNGVANGNVGERHRATMRLQHNLVLLERFAVLRLDVQAEQIGPGYVELQMGTRFGSMCILQTVTPIEPLLQRVSHLIFAPLLLAPYATLALIGESLMFERDVAVWNHKRFEKNPVLVSEDRAIRAYRRWYSQFYSTNSPTYHSASQSLQW